MIEGYNGGFAMARLAIRNRDGKVLRRINAWGDIEKDILPNTEDHVNASNQEQERR